MRYRPFKREWRVTGQWNDYWYWRHARILAASDGFIGWQQGLGIIAIRVTWRDVH
jgi:hypothetical protein